MFAPPPLEKGGSGGIVDIMSPMTNERQLNMLYPKTRKKTPRTMTLVEQVAASLKEDILNGRLRGGDALREDRLKEEFGISRTPLREAFRILENEGLIEILPRRGAYVKRITRKDIEENFPVRAALEGLAARLAHKNLTPQELRDMEEVYQYMRDAASRGEVHDYSMHHAAFHEVFINASRNETLIGLLRHLRMHTLWHRYTYHYYKEDFDHSLEIHRKIVELFKNPRTQGQMVENVVREHIEEALTPFINAMKKLEDSGAPPPGS